MKAIKAVLILPVLFWAAVAAAKPKEAPVKVDSLDPAVNASYRSPKGWTVERSAKGAEPSVRYASSQNVLQIRSYGGKRSRFASPADFLRGPEATTMGRPPEALKTAKVAGAKVTVYRHGYPIDLGDPHAPASGATKLASESFCVVPAAKGRFYVLSYAWESEVPDAGSAGEDAWAALLSSFKPVK